jgi:hypothetical protein
MTYTHIGAEALQSEVPRCAAGLDSDGRRRIHQHSSIVVFGEQGNANGRAAWNAR